MIYRLRGLAGLIALLFALVSVSAFALFASVFGPIPKALAYNPNLALDLYFNAPTISAVTGLAAAVIAAAALLPDGRVLRAGAGGLAVGLVAFLLATIVSSTALLSSPTTGFNSDFPVVRIGPPDVGVAVLVVGVIAFVYRVRSVAGQRIAVAALISGGVMASYWLLSLVLLNFSSE